MTTAQLFKAPHDFRGAMDPSSRKLALLSAVHGAGCAKFRVHVEAIQESTVKVRIFPPLMEFNSHSV